MYSIEPAEYGVKLTFEGFIDAAEMNRWLDESRKFLNGLEKDFCVFVDMRNLKPLSPLEKDIIKRGQMLYKSMGMKRSVVILSNPVTNLQFTKIAHESGIFEGERYIDASRVSDWEQVALDWLIRGVQPCPDTGRILV